jgi:methionyl-tRNA formyltransferase
MKITILTDDSDSWFIPFGYMLKGKLEDLGHTVYYVFNKSEIHLGDICYLLSCKHIIGIDDLNRNKNNIVIHASDLPKGKGFSPLQWQILEGKNDIVLTLFEAVEECDAGPFYIKDKIHFKGTELLDELREKLGLKIVEMAIHYVKNKDKLVPKEQVGESSFYRRRTLKDDEIDPNKTIIEQFNHFRIADNERYPLYFHYKGEKYYIKIFKENKGKL